MSLFDNKKNKHVDMSVDDMREFLDISKEMFEVQLPRLVQKEQVIPVGNLNGNDVSKINIIFIFKVVIKIEL